VIASLAPLLVSNQIAWVLTACAVPAVIVIPPTIGLYRA
jgi:hypothetical protein